MSSMLSNMFLFQSLSQGDSAAFQKSVKVLGYQMRIMMSLIEAFIDDISDCEIHVVKHFFLFQSLSQGDSAAFQKSVKVLGYQMRIMMTLIEAFVDYISDWELHVVKHFYFSHYLKVTVQPSRNLSRSLGTR